MEVIWLPGFEGSQIVGDNNMEAPFSIQKCQFTEATTLPILIETLFKKACNPIEAKAIRH